MMRQKLVVRQKLVLGAVAMALAGTGTLALAQTTPSTAEKKSAATQQRMDRNKDGTVSQAEREESAAQWEARFRAADKNGDGGLSRPEVEAGKFPRVRDNFAAIDTNRDGKVTLNEVHAWRDAQKAARQAPVTPTPAR
jgi:hypothetical protein